MPRKKRTIIEENLPDNTGDGIDGEDQISAFDVALESVEDLEALTNTMEQFGQTGQLLKVYRESGEYCYQSDNVDESFIQKHFGGGGYRIRLFLNGKYKKTFPVSCAAPIVTEANGNGNHRDHHSEFLEKMLLTILANGNVSKGPSISELTGALANLDGLRGKQESAMDLFQKGMTFAKEIYDSKPNGSGDWKSEAIGAIKEALPVVGGIIAAKTGAPQPSMPTPTNPNELVQATPEQQTQAIRQGLNYLKQRCLKGVDPQLIVDWVENNAEDYQPLIHMVLNLPFEKFVEIDAEIGNEPFKQWFTELFNGLRSAFVPDNQVDVDSTGQHGNSDNAGNHGNTGTDPKRKGK